MDNIKIVTYNIRCVWKGWTDGKNGFIHRAGMVFEKIMEELPEVILFQEVVEPHYKLLTRMFPEYEFYGHFRNEDFGGEGLYTAVRKDRIQVLGYDSYWLSPTPYVPGSRFENQSECPRTCLTLKLRDRKTNKLFKAINVHLDHISDEARIEGIKLLLERAGEDLKKDNLPVILGGDFNARPESDTIKYCNSYDKLKIFDVTKDIKTTFHNYGEKEAKIDYIYATKDVKGAVSSVYIWDDVDEEIYLSDHYPICMEIDIEKL